MTFVHRQLAAGGWSRLSLPEQLANVGSEVERALAWQKKDPSISRHAFERALELLDLTLADPRWRGRRREPARVREVLVDYFAGENLYRTSPDSLKHYFFAFAYHARRRVS